MKKVVCCLMSLILLLLLISCSESKTVDFKTVAELLSQDQLASRGLSEQNVDYIGENVAAYNRAENETVIYLYSSPIEKNGNLLQEKEELLEATGDYFLKRFPLTLSGDSGIEIGEGYNYINILLGGDRESSGKTDWITNAFGQKRQAVVYQNAFGKGQDYRCFPTSFGVNTEIVIPKKVDEATFRVKIQLPNLVPDTSSPDYVLFKTALNKGEVRSILYTPLVCDRNGNWSYKNTVKLVEKDSATNTYTIEYTVDPAFLTSKSTKYPLNLNQSIHLYKSKQPDTSAYENTGDVAGHYLSPYMLLGDQTLKGEGWTYIRYETLNTLALDPDKIVSAKYVFHNLFDLPQEAKIGAYAVTADWCSINTRWFNRPPFDENPVAETIVQSRGDYELDITYLIQEMIRNNDKENFPYSIQNSFMIRCDTENTNIALAAGDNGLFSPLLEIVVAE